MDPLFDTIAAICTAPGAAGIAVVRLSGPGALAAADQAFRGHGPAPSSCPSHTVHHGFVVSNHGAPLDEVLLLIMRRPRSFTGDDVAEFHCHGGHMPATRCLQRLLECGARPAAPGEFTRRAFLNGRIDLTQAEAVLDLIRSHSERSADTALRQLRGALRENLDAVRLPAMETAAVLEASLDFPEEDPVPYDLPALVAVLRGCSDRCRTLAASCRQGRVLRDGIRIVIAGRPNAGKSSLFNLLVGHRRAIVSPRAGTTRDTIEEWLSIAGYPVLLIDTAGIASSPCEIEQEGVRRSMDELDSSDFVLYVVDANDGLQDSDRATLRGLAAAKVLIVWNKTDLLADAAKAHPPDSWPSISTSCTETSTNEVFMSILADLMTRSMGALEAGAPAVSERHRILLDAASGAFSKAADLLGSPRDDAPELASAHIRDGVENLDAVTGARFDNDLLDRIFSAFCIGK